MSIDPKLFDGELSGLKSAIDSVVQAVNIKTGKSTAGNFTAEDQGIQQAAMNLQSALLAVHPIGGGELVKPAPQPGDEHKEEATAEKKTAQESDHKKNQKKHH